MEGEITEEVLDETPPAASEQISPAISPAAPSSPTVASVKTPTPTRSPSIKQARNPSPSSAKSIERKSIKSIHSAKSIDRKSIGSNPSPKSPKSLLTNPSSETRNDKSLDDHLQALTLSVKRFSKDIEEPPAPIPDTNIDKIANMSKFLTQEANALRQSIRTLSEDIVKTKQELLAGCACAVPHEDVNFPYHLFLIEIIINKIHMKCECFDVDLNNLVITATFLGKPPVILYDPSYGKIENMSKLNVGKSTLFAMTYDKICSINDFEIIVELTKQPPCSSCITRIGETHMDYTKEFFKLREELCNKWNKDKPRDDILCTTSTPLSKNLYYLSCGDSDHSDSIGVIEITVRMSFLGKEITTSFCGSSRQTSKLKKEDNGMAMYSCQKVEMDDQDRILLDEGVFDRKSSPYHESCNGRSQGPISEISSIASTNRQYGRAHYNNNTYHTQSFTHNDGMGKYDEILTKVNSNELKIRVPKSNKIDRTGKYDKIQELCSCEDTPYNTGDQIQFEMPRDVCGRDKSQNLKYSYNGYIKETEPKNRKVISVTPSNCPVPVAMEKRAHPNNDVFILKIGKKLETADKKTDLEIELVTPKLPHKNTEAVAQQCSSDKIATKSKGKKKGDNKKSGRKQPKKGKGDGSKKKKKAKN